MDEQAISRIRLATQLHHQIGRKLGAAFNREGITEELLAALMEEDRMLIYQEMYGDKTHMQHRDTLSGSCTPKEM